MHIDKIKMKVVLFSNTFFYRMEFILSSSKKTLILTIVRVELRGLKFKDMLKLTKITKKIKSANWTKEYESSYINSGTTYR